MARKTLSFGGAGNYPGSSGYWADAGSGGSGSAGAGGYNPTLGYPGDVARGNMGFTSRYGNVGGAGDTASLYSTLRIPKSPGVSQATNDLMASFRQGADAIPGYHDILKDVTSGRDEINRTYGNYQNALDIGPYAAGQRGLDYRSGQLVNDFSGTARDIGSRYAASDANYATQGKSALDAVLGNAADFRDKEIPASIQAAMDAAQQNASRYGLVNDGGYSSALASLSAREATKSSLPFRLQANQNYGDALSRYQPFYGDVAGRNATRAGFDLSSEGNIYQQQQNSIMQQKQTEDKIQNLKMQTAGLSMDAAIKKMATSGATAQLISQVLGLPSEYIKQKASALGAILALDEGSNYLGLNYNPGANLNQPQYFNNTLPSYPMPSRYDVPQTATGNNGGRSNAPGVSSNPVDIAYHNQTGFWPSTDPNFEPNAYQYNESRIASRYA